MIWKKILSTMATFGTYVIFWGVYGVHVCFRWIILTYYRWINAGCFAKYKIIHHWYLGCSGVVKFAHSGGIKQCRRMSILMDFLNLRVRGLGCCHIMTPVVCESPSLGFMMGFVCFQRVQNVTPPEDLNNLAGCRIAHQKRRWKFDEPVRYTGSPH